MITKQPDSPMEKIRIEASFYAFSKCSQLRNTSVEEWIRKCDNFYSEELARLLNKYHPPYYPPSFRERFKKWLKRIFN